MRPFSVLFGAALIAATTAATLTTPALGAPRSDAPICTLFANEPTRSGATITANGGRTGCADQATITVRIISEHNNSAYNVISEKSQHGSQIILTPMAPCQTDQTITVRTETTSSTGAVYRSSPSTFEHC
jgi:hypothetical protein